MAGHSRYASLCGYALIVGAVLAGVTACSGSGSPPAAGTGQPTAASAQPDSTPPPVSTTAAPVSPRPTGPTVSPPTPGNIHQTVASGSISTLRPIALSSPAVFPKAQLSGAVSRVARVNAQAHIPGEIAGPALSFRLTLTNDGTKPVDVGTSVAVTAADAHGTPLSPLDTSTKAVAGTLRPGDQAHGTYLFHLPAGFHNPMTISVSYAGTAEIARFVGSVS